jgi:Flp pilus assembly protein TadG
MKSKQAAGILKKGLVFLRHRQRGAVAVQVAVFSTAMMGFAALAVDVGLLYNTRAELQRTADAAALAAAAELGQAVADPRVAAKGKAQEYARENLVLNDDIQLDENAEIVFGQAWIDETTGKYVFQPDSACEFPNAVKVITRRTEGSINGAVSLFFARAMGFQSADVSAEATAVLIPRDIAVVADLSASHTDDSEIKHMYDTTVNTREIWTSLPNDSLNDSQTDSSGFTTSVRLSNNYDGTTTVTVTVTSDGSEDTKALSHITFGLPEEAWDDALSTAYSDGDYSDPEAGVDPTTEVGGIKFDAEGDGLGEDGAEDTHTFSFTIANEYLEDLTIATKAGQTVDSSVTYNLQPGPVFGRMDHWGTTPMDSTYDLTADSGLMHLPYNQSWTENTELRSFLENEGYIESEISALLSNTYDTDGGWEARVAVALGLARWRSGHIGGLWEQKGGDPGNGNDWVGWNSELTWLVEYPYVDGSWGKYIQYLHWTGIQNTFNGDFKYRYGLKTFVNYLLEQEPELPEFASCPVQPMEAVKEASRELVNVVEAMDSSDLISLAGYGTHGYGPNDYPDDLSWLTNDFNSLRAKIGGLQGGKWTRNTNIAQGIDDGVNVLTNSPNARAGAAKVMILLTDGKANHVRAEPTYYDTTQARTDTVTAAETARAQGIRIYTVSVGASADQSLMQKVADIGSGESFHAEGEISDYEQELKSIFQTLGGKRPVILIE